MGIGPTVRHRLGRWERPISAAYRGFFVDLDHLAARLAEQVDPKRILEIGCGEGAFAERLLKTFPSAEYLGIDIVPTVGRGFVGDHGRAEFRLVSSSDLRTERREPFDLVLLVDVVHHIPLALRHAVLRDAGAMTAADGVLVVKDWERRRNPNHLIQYAADRYLSGDRDVCFARPEELRALLTGALPEFVVRSVEGVKPRSNNIVYVMTRLA